MIGNALGELVRVIEGQAPARKKIVILRSQRIPYDPAVRLAGGRTVEIGIALQTFPWEVGAALNARTPLLLYVAADHLRRSALPLETTLAIAHAAGVPALRFCSFVEPSRKPRERRKHVLPFAVSWADLARAVDVSFLPGHSSRPIS